MFTAAIGRRSARDLGRRTTNPARRTKDPRAPRQTGGVFVFMDYSKLGGLIPAVIQDAETAEVLMVGFMNEAALALNEAGRLQLESPAKGDYADFTLTIRAKLESDAQPL